MEALRAPFFITSLIPVVFAAALGIHMNRGVEWHLLPLVIIGVLAIHAVTNLANEYFDFKKGVDIMGVNGPGHVLVEGIIKPYEVFIMMWLFSIVAAICALILYKQWGTPILVFAITGFAAGFLYTAPPVAYKYHAMGDVMIFIIMGPLLVLGSYTALTGIVDPKVLLLAIPFGLLITAVLHSNNMRDMKDDKKSGVKTLANKLGYNMSKKIYYTLIIIPYFYVVFAAYYGVGSLWFLLVLFALPIALKNIHIIQKGDVDGIMKIDLHTVGHYVVFSALYIAAILMDIIKVT
jgi:1,4-dihydroxy-2-naphthoate octaprenyltransferase